MVHSFMLLDLHVTLKGHHLFLLLLLNKNNNKDSILYDINFVGLSPYKVRALRASSEIVPTKKIVDN